MSTYVNTKGLIESSKSEVLKIRAVIQIKIKNEPGTTLPRLPNLLELPTVTHYN